MSKITDSETYKRVLDHRKECVKWPMETKTYITKGGFCMECFGGGLNKFTEDLMDELGLS